MTENELYRELSTVEEWADRPFTHAKEVARRNDMSRQAARNKLESLVNERDNVHRYKPARDVIYYVD